MGTDIVEVKLPDALVVKPSLTEDQIKEIIKQKKAFAKANAKRVINSVNEILNGKAAAIKKIAKTEHAPKLKKKLPKTKEVEIAKSITDDKIEEPKEFAENRKKLLALLDNMDKSFMKINPTAYTRERKVFGEIVSSIKDNEKKDFVSLEKEANISYAAKKGNPYLPKNRVTTTLGRYARRVLSITTTQLPDRFLSSIADEMTYYLVFPNKTDVSLLSGKDISTFYKAAKIHSCMTGASSKLTSLYANNPDKIQLAVYKNQARALLWTCDDGRKALDRIYPDGSRISQLLEKWAKDNKYLIRKDLKSAFPVTVDVSSAEIPYIDTFRYAKADYENKKIIMSPISAGGYTELGSLFRYGQNGKAIMPWEKSYLCGYCNCYFVENDKKEEVNTIINNKKKTLTCCPSCFKRLVHNCVHCEKPFAKPIFGYSGLNSYGKSCDACKKLHYISCMHCYGKIDKTNKAEFVSAMKFGAKTKKYGKMCVRCAKAYCYIMKEDKE